MSRFEPHRHLSLAMLLIGVALVGACRDKGTTPGVDSNPDGVEARFDSARWDEATFEP